MQNFNMHDKMAVMAAYREQQTMDALREHYTNRDKPKPPAPVDNELAEFYKGLQNHAAKENAKRMNELEECFKQRNAQRMTKSK